MQNPEEVMAVYVSAEKLSLTRLWEKRAKFLFFRESGFLSFSSPEATFLLPSTKNRDLWEGPIFFYVQSNGMKTLGMRLTVDFKIVVLRALVFPFRWPKVTKALGTRLEKSAVSFEEQIVSRDKYLSIFFNIKWRRTIVSIILQIFFATRVVLKIGEYSRIFPSFSRGIFDHVTRLDQSRASENIWWIITSFINLYIA